MTPPLLALDIPRRERAKVKRFARLLMNRGHVGIQNRITVTGINGVRRCSFCVVYLNKKAEGKDVEVRLLS